MALNYLVDAEWIPNVLHRSDKSVFSTFGDQSSFDDHLKKKRIDKTKRRQYKYTILPVEVTDEYNAHEF